MYGELEERRRQPQDDVVTAPVKAELPLPDGAGTRQLTVEELLGILQQLIGAGNETSTKLFSQMIRNLADEHDEWWKLKADPGRASIVVEEALRLASPTQGLYRKVTRYVEIEGTSIPAGDRLLVMFAAANRDPPTFPDPDTFRPDRANVRDHLAFGYGVHFCIGAPLARLENCGRAREVGSSASMISSWLPTTRSSSNRASSCAASRISTSSSRRPPALRVERSGE